MKKQKKSSSKRQSRRLPAPLQGRAVYDLAWDCASPRASEMFDDVRAISAEPFWGTVSGVSIWHAATLKADAARRAYERTDAPVLLRVREVAWLHHRKQATGYCTLLWAALLARLSTSYPEASDGQLWVLIRDEILELCRERHVVEADGR